MDDDRLLVLYPQIRREEEERARVDEVLRAALDGIDAEIVEDMDLLEQDPYRYRGRRILFVIPLGRNGINRGYYEFLAWLRGGDQVLAGATAGMIIDADSEFYTKATARELAVAANRAGCAFVGRPLVEGTASLDNYLVQSVNMKTDRFGAYKKSAAILARQIQEETWKPKDEAHLLVLHASNHRTSNTLAIWQKVKGRLDDRIRIREVNGTLVDCSGCPYQMCLHFGEQGKCFYGGAMVEAIYPAVKWADAILLLCPNYNDALSANMTAFINRLTALCRTTRFYDKALFGIIVSGYSGSDLLAGQLITALNMNKTFYLPGNFCMMETANNAGAAMKLPGIEDRIRKFSEKITHTLIKEANLSDKFLNTH